MMKNMKNRKYAFTLVEVMIVVIIVGILAAIAIPMYTSAASVQLSAAANMVASDLEYAKSMAISTGKNYQVVFDTTAESYCIQTAGATIVHPVRVGQNYVVTFASDSRLDKVDITSTTFGTGDTISFDYLGTPSVNNGEIVLTAQGGTMKVKIESVTGYISIE
jgi:prepilin-type N-terminal cleavage/methylation domain-containing protein